MAAKKTPRTLQEITLSLGKSYKAWKAGESAKEKDRKDFMAAAILQTKLQPLAQKTVDVPTWIDNQEQAEAWLAQYHSGWIAQDTSQDADGTIYVLLEENPEYKDFVFVNPVDKKVYRRQIREGSKLLDDERLREQDPDLWNRITHEVRVPLPADQVDPTDLAELQKYMYFGEPKPLLAAVRDAKEEELQDA